MNNYSYSSNPSDMAAGIIGLFGVTLTLIVILVSVLLSLALTAFIIIINWKLLEKAGEPGWKAIIPFYNLYTFNDISLTKPTSIVVFVAYMVAYMGLFLCWIPYLGILVSVVISPVFYATTGILNFSLAKSFGRDTAMCILSIFFPPITRAIMAFSKDVEYTGDKVSIFPASN